LFAVNLELPVVRNCTHSRIRKGLDLASLKTPHMGKEKAEGTDAISLCGSPLKGRKKEM